MKMASKSLASSSATSKTVTAKYSADTSLLTEFEQSNVSGKSFDYRKSIANLPPSLPEEQIQDYLSKLQRGGLIQSFGCLLVVEVGTFKIIGYSENCFSLLGLNPIQISGSSRLETLIGIDLATLLKTESATLLLRALASEEMYLWNPVWVYAKTTNKPFYAILHNVGSVGILIDLEPGWWTEPLMSNISIAHSQKHAVRAISRLQSLPPDDICALCDTIVDEVKKLTRYDRVMVYKFHEDNHGEVISESVRPDLEPYLGLHYPETDIPQIARFLFQQNRIRIIYDCRSEPLRVIQSEELKQPICLVGSTLRAPHSCHMQYMANMGSIASFVMAIIVFHKDATKLWGLIVCHHMSPRYLAYPIRYACQTLAQAFSVQLYLKLQLVAEVAEKKIMKTQISLRDMLIRNNPLAVVTESPNIMDLVKCDGAAMYYGQNVWLLGITPTEAQVKDITVWSLANHGESSTISTNSLAEAGYPGAASLGGDICGMAMARIAPEYFLYWFRSNTAKEVKWGKGVRPQENDDDEKIGPRTSFKAFLEISRAKSLPWEVLEMNAISSLQLILKDLPQDSKRSFSETVVSLPKRDELGSVASEMARVIQTAIVPIFRVDLAGCINGWNSKVAELTGLEVSHAMGKSLVNEVVHKESRRLVQNLISSVLQGVENKNVEIQLRNFKLDSTTTVVHLLVNVCPNRDYTNKVVGISFVGQDITYQKNVIDKFICVQGDYNSVVQSLDPLIPPMFFTDENTCCCEWNPAMEKLTGFKKRQVIGKIVPGEVFGGLLCRLRSQNMLRDLMILFYQVFSGQTTEKFLLGFYDAKGEYAEVYLTASKRINARGDTVGCLCLVQVNDSGPSDKNSQVDHQLRQLAYLRREVKNPLRGIQLTHGLLETAFRTETQKQVLETSHACQRQILAVIEGLDLKSIEDGTLNLNMEEFVFESVLNVIVSQVVLMLKERNVDLVHNVPEEIKTLSVIGDKIRLQMVLSHFLLCAVDYAPYSNGWVEIKIQSVRGLIHEENNYIQAELRIIHPGEGLPCTLVEEMSGSGNEAKSTAEGIGLKMSRKLLNRMNGDVEYVRDQSLNLCYFIINFQLLTKTEPEEMDETK